MGIEAIPVLVFFLYIGCSVVIFSIINLKKIKIMRSYGNRGYSSIRLHFDLSLIIHTKITLFT